MKLKEVKKIKGKIIVETGLHIGGSVESMEIGGVDNPIIRNPANREPYIPGSSLKGKMRSLMEWELGKMGADGKPCGCANDDCKICRIFGSSAGKNAKTGPTRLIVRDSFITEKSRNAFKEGMEIIEIKHENSINRITAMANPRPLERVNPGVEFDLDISFKVIDSGDGGSFDEKAFTDVALKALALVQEDSLGGSGSRGCGKVRFELVDENGTELKLPQV